MCKRTLILRRQKKEGRGKVKRRWRKRPVSVADSPRHAASIIDSRTHYTLTSAALNPPAKEIAPKIGALRKSAEEWGRTAHYELAQELWGMAVNDKVITALRSKPDRFAYRDNPALTKRNAMDDGTSAKDGDATTAAATAAAVAAEVAAAAAAAGTAAAAATAATAQ